MANEAKNGPRLFTVEPVDGRWQWINKKYKLHLWCEAEDCQHPVYDDDGLGIYEFKMTQRVDCSNCAIRQFHRWRDENPPADGRSVSQCIVWSWHVRPMEI